MNLSDLPNRIRKLMETVNPDDVALVSTLKTAAESFEHVLKTSSDIRYACEQETLACERGAEIERLQKALEHERKNTLNARAGEDEANEIIAKIAKAAECENFADIILARVEALNQQSNAMPAIFAGHIATFRRETAKADDYLRANKELSGRIDVLNNQGNKMRHLLHAIADKLSAGSRSAIPAEDWYLERIDQIACNYRDYLDVIGEAVGKPDMSYKDLAEYFHGLDVEGLKKIADKANATEAERAKLAGKLADAERHVKARDISLNQLAQALKVDQSEEGWATTMLSKANYLMLTVNSKDYKWDKEKTDALQSLLQAHGFWYAYNNVEGLNKFKDFVKGLGAEIQRYEVAKKEWDRDLADAQKGAAAARSELDLAVSAIRRMHAKLLENKPRTGIWPADGTFRAKLDDIEWCLYVYIGRVIADGQLHEADTKFIADVRDSLSFEILRRNKQ